MTQKGTHTWDLVVDYHRCPQCGFIIESRDAYHYQLGSWIKELQCERCGHSFTHKKMRKPAFGPLFGDPQPKEMDWQ